MHVTRVTAPFVGLVLLAGCGAAHTSASGKTVIVPVKPAPKVATLTTDYGSVLRAAVTKTAAQSARMVLTIDTGTDAGDATVSGTGVFAKTAAGSVGDLVLSIAGMSLEERITGGELYLKVPNQPGWYALPLAKLVGTSLATSSNPLGSASVLLAAGNDVQKVGTATLRGTATTHYRGSIALTPTKIGGALGQLANKGLAALKAGGASSVPFDAYVDSQGRLRKLVENVDLTVKAQTVHVTTTIEEYDFGVPVNVVAPPASEIKDGAALLNGLKHLQG